MSLLLLFAQEGQQQPPGALPGGPMAPLFILGLVVLFLLVVVFPAQRRQKKDQEQVIASIKRGTKVLTNAGIVATVVSAKDGEDEIVIRSEDTKLRIKRNVVVQVLGSDDAEAAKQ
ncbi:Preprotein translocase subunit YajC OS=Hyphomonas johnsonii MHS-2 GN=HJO_05365 PE=4 SV=1: YajC [Gemmata massiliana]|uniref:Sec translocon accessory complex subunit YajC n=1 Tax=Gemmata massiliana TaxID=1210884 RepID=A0A6P2CUM2_9BACT|nr:preprotein translocase subunit YajC [Gemmata massiliana]VTR92681.1 Preprotein translocase subunit YajC OS=Hyphomonas johnsonii MHS-2 GN=HJO_05365 PE=4 SV=1: YajC [Gemmata massiliana]